MNTCPECGGEESSAVGVFYHNPHCPAAPYRTSGSKQGYVGATIKPPEHWHICKHGVKIPCEAEDCAYCHPINELQKDLSSMDDPQYKLMADTIRENDMLWCKALIGTLPLDKVNKVLTLYLQLRAEYEKDTVTTIHSKRL